MRNVSKMIGTTLLTVLLCAGFSTVALSVDREVYDKPNVQTGNIIKGKVMSVNPDAKAAQTWHVGVKDNDTGQVVVLHVDKTTTRKDIMMSPDLGDNVIAKYNEQKHAISFLTDQAMSH
ncbi:MAG: hypothetical protein NDI90_00105 [Nitrospira sp. BO4]|nr:hypothetical protein [Nitrospira sp. BO4]